MSWDETRDEPEEGGWWDGVFLLMITLPFIAAMVYTNVVASNRPPTPTPVSYYDITLKVLARPVVYKEMQGEADAFFGGGGREGGGIVVGSGGARLEEKRTFVVRGEVVSVFPEHPTITETQHIILTTEDVRVLALPVDARVTFRCTHYWEGKIGKCRMATEVFTPPPSPPSRGE